MSTFGKYGTGGNVPGDYETQVPKDDNSGGFVLMTANIGTETNQPDSKPETDVPTFGRPEHNPTGAMDHSTTSTAK